MKFNDLGAAAKSALDGLFDKKNSNANQKQAIGKFHTVIGIDTELHLIHLCNMVIGDTGSFHHESQVYKAGQFDDEFFRKLTEILESYSAKYPSSQSAPVSIVLPDYCVSANTLSIPTMSKAKNEASLQILLDEFYKDTGKLKINSMPVVQNKQYTTYAVSMIRQDLLQKLYGACSANKMIPDSVTFAANAAVNAIFASSPKSASETYILLDIKQDSATYSLVSKGRTVGFYNLPFGYKIIQKTRLVAENMLFDTPDADLLVLNAIERAKVKQLSVMQSDMPQTLSEDGESSFDDASEGAQQKVMQKKAPLKLPKFMLRPQPANEQEYMYENFRIFIKWALNLIQNNKATLIENVKNVYVNMPEEYAFLFDMTNAEKEENGVNFASLKSKDVPKKFLECLELYGGFFACAQNSVHSF